MKCAKLLAGAILALAGVPGMAATCSAEVHANDAMQFNTKAIVVDKSCEKFTVVLKHTGRLPKSAMGHNWVLTRTEDMQAVATAGIKAGLAKEYLAEDDDRIIAHTRMIGGGESDSITFDVSLLSPDEPYSFFCTFPGHFAIMKGSLSVSP